MAAVRSETVAPHVLDVEANGVQAPLLARGGVRGELDRQPRSLGPPLRRRLLPRHSTLPVGASVASRLGRRAKQQTTESKRPVRAGSPHLGRPHSLSPGSYHYSRSRSRSHRPRRRSSKRTDSYWPRRRRRWRGRRHTHRVRIAPRNGGGSLQRQGDPLRTGGHALDALLVEGLVLRGMENKNKRWACLPTPAGIPTEDGPIPKVRLRHSDDVSCPSRGAAAGDGLRRFVSSSAGATTGKDGPREIRARDQRAFRTRHEPELLEWQNGKQR